MQNFEVCFENGSERRSAVFIQPDVIFAAMAAQMWAPYAFKLPWNQVADQTKWKIVVIAKNGERYEEQAQIPA
jgi:hypothetical protein